MILQIITLKKKKKIIEKKISTLMQNAIFCASLPQWTQAEATKHLKVYSNGRVT
jgi:hypothetical protein